MPERLRSLLYRLYEQKLLSEVKKDRLPYHVGLILDGNRRYAKEKKLESLSEGYKKGADKLDDVLFWCEELRIKMITIWVLSTENLCRESEELSQLLNVIENKIMAIAQDPRIHKKRIRIRAVGKMELLPESTRQVIAHAEEVTRKYQSFFLNIAVGYGGRQEIVDAIKKLLKTRIAQDESIETIINSLTPDEVSKYLYTFDLPDPDLIIRTSGEIRLSGFLLWQSAYSEFYFCDVNWPAFRKIDFLRAIRSYQQRQRRFGI
jgi:short-chain Z-isoprenyl diphosphate synthase